jgi:hypothetical protein
MRPAPWRCVVAAGQRPKCGCSCPARVSAPRGDSPSAQCRACASAGRGRQSVPVTGSGSRRLLNPSYVTPAASASLPGCRPVRARASVSPYPVRGRGRGGRPPRHRSAAGRGRSRRRRSRRGHSRRGQDDVAGGAGRGGRAEAEGTAQQGAAGRRGWCCREVRHVTPRVGRLRAGVRGARFAYRPGRGPYGQLDRPVGRSGRGGAALDQGDQHVDGAVGDGGEVLPDGGQRRGEVRSGQVTSTTWVKQEFVRHPLPQHPHRLTS